jgi:hypothetical protein
MNRDTAVLKGFAFVRLTPVSGIANVSSAFWEQWAKKLHKRRKSVAATRTGPPFIQYADLTDLMLMLHIALGGGVMHVVNEGQQLIERRAHE